MTGYSGKPLYQKLGFTTESIITVLNQPESYGEWLGYESESFKITVSLKPDTDIIHGFFTERKKLVGEIGQMKSNMKQNGMIWISWPKGKSKIQTDLNEDFIRNTAIENGLVDVKVCAVSDDWSALKLVIPLKLRV